MNVKEELYQRCVNYVEERMSTIENTISSLQKALVSETKSSAGDKHETGRAMLQLEMEKAGQQLGAVQQMKETLQKIDVSKKTILVSLGAVVETSLGNYFLSISAGQLTVEEKTYFAISTSSPIGNLLLGKQKGDVLYWNGKDVNIHRVS